MATEEELKALRQASEGSAKKARALLEDEIKAVMNEVTHINELKPRTVNEEVYNKIVSVVEEATAKNHSIAILKQNLQNLGEGAVALFKEMAVIAKTMA